MVSMNGGDPIPGPFSSVEGLGAEVALSTMIKSLKSLEKTIKCERLRLTKELDALQVNRAQSHKIFPEAIEAVGR